MEGTSAGLQLFREGTFLSVFNVFVIIWISLQKFRIRKKGDFFLKNWSILHCRWQWRHWQISPLLIRILNQCCRLNHFVFSRGVETTSKSGKNAGLGKVSFSPHIINQFLSGSWAAVKHIVFYRAREMPPPTQPWRKYLGCWKVARLVMMMMFENISPFKNWVLSSKKVGIDDDVWKYFSIQKLGFILKKSWYWWWFLKTFVQLLQNLIFILIT